MYPYFALEGYGTSQPKDINPVTKDISSTLPVAFDLDTVAIREFHPRPFGSILAPRTDLATFGFGLQEHSQVLQNAVLSLVCKPPSTRPSAAVLCEFVTNLS